MPEFVFFFFFFFFTKYLWIPPFSGAHWWLIPASVWLISVAQLADEWAGYPVSFIRSILSSPFSSWSAASNLALFYPPSDSAEDALRPCFTPPSCCAACRILPLNSHLYSRPLRLFLPQRSVCWRLFKGLFHSFFVPLTVKYDPSHLASICFTLFLVSTFLLSYFSSFTWKTAPASLTCSLTLAKHIS